MTKQIEVCPICEEDTTITKTLDGNWDVWVCDKNGCRKDYMIVKYKGESK